MPQGSVFGTLLFVLYSNDMKRYFTKSVNSKLLSVQIKILCNNRTSYQNPVFKHYARSKLELKQQSRFFM